MPLRSERASTANLHPPGGGAPDDHVEKSMDTVDPGHAPPALTGSRTAREADARTRTGDPFITSEVLYQLSYVGNADLV